MMLFSVLWFSVRNSSHSPHQLVAESGKEVLMLDTHQLCFEPRLANLDDAAARHGADKRVDAKSVFHLRVLVAETQTDIVGKDDGPLGQRMRRNRGNHKASRLGGKDGTTAAERIGSAAGGCGNDDAISSIGRHPVAVHLNLGVQQRLLLLTVQVDLVQCKKCSPFSALPQINFQHRTRFDGVTTLVEADCQLLYVVPAGCGEKAQMTEIDAHNGDAAVANLVNGTEQGSIAANAYHHVDTLGMAPCFDYLDAYSSQLFDKSPDTLHMLRGIVLYVNCYFQMLWWFFLELIELSD